LCSFQFVVTQDGVERDENFAVEAMRFFAQTFNVLQRIRGAGPRPKRWSADVHRVCTVVNGGNANVRITRGGEQFELVVEQRHGVNYLKKTKAARRPLCAWQKR
jgi:hypothetical protein